MANLSRSQRDRAMYRPPTFLGNNAMPLLWRTAPRTGRRRKLRKSVVVSSCGAMSAWSKAV